MIRFDMKRIFENILLSGALIISFAANSQLTPNGNSGSSTTNYTNGASNDPIYIWCADGLTNNTASLTATPSSGTGPFTFNWFFHDQSNFSWSPYNSETGATSTMTNMPSDGYRVEIYDAGNNLVGCYVAWVWNMNSEVTATNTPSACDATGLNGAVSVNGSFTYYNPPPPESLINASTQISVCFTANHTYVSDLGFYLVGPAACGSPTIALMPHPELINTLNGCCCNSGNNINNLCFTTNPVGNISPCTAGAPLTGTYSGYSSAYGDNVTINWSSLYGCNAAEGGWRVQIYDCIGSDIGALTNATITFSNLTSICGSPTTLSYTSGAINSAINDNSCSAGSASIFQVPITPNLTTPITINANVSYLWTSSPVVSISSASSSLTPALTALPNGTTDFTLTASVSYGTANCENTAQTSFIQTCCTALADAGTDQSICTGENTTLGTSAVANMTYSWSPSTGLSDPSSAQPTITLTNSGSTVQTFTYTLTVTNIADGGCTDIDDVEITVNPLPLVTSGTYTPVCVDAGNVQLSGTPAGGTFSGVGVAVDQFDPSSGSQTITYTFTDGNGCTSSSSSVITVNPLPNIGAGNDLTICIGEQVTLNGTGGTTYTWDNGAINGTPFSTVLGVSVYTVTGTDVNGCVNTDVVTVNTLSYPVVDVSADQQSGNPVLSVNFTDLSSGGDIYSWDFGNGQTSIASFPTNQTMNYGIPGTYTMELTVDNGGCSVSDTLIIIVIPFPDPIIRVPNIFTPNQDGSNDEFFIDSEFVSELNVIIINRWGNAVAEITTPLGVWDGTINGNPADDGVYFFRYEATGLNGDVLTGHGNITLVR